MAILEQAVHVEELAPSAPAGDDSGVVAVLIADIVNLVGEVDALRAELEQLKDEQPHARAPAGETAYFGATDSTVYANSDAFSAAEEFRVAGGTGDGLENLGIVFQDQAMSDVDLLSTDCQGNMCRLSYDAQGKSLGSSVKGTMTLSRLLAENVGGNVDVVFENEDGASVMYVTRVK